MPATLQRLGYLTASLSRRGAGVFESVAGLAAAIVDRGVELRLYGIQDLYTDEDVRIARACKVTAPPKRGPTAFGFAPGLIGALVRDNNQLIHIQGLWMYPSVATLFWASRTKRPYVVSPQGMLDPWALNNSRWKKNIAGLMFENRHLKGASCLHALNEQEAQAMRQYGLYGSVCVIPNGVDLPNTRKAHHAPWASLFSQDQKVLLFLGRLHPKKGLSNLLRGWQLARRSRDGHDWQLVIVGSGKVKYVEALNRLAAELSIANTVHFLGARFGHEKDAAFQNASAFVLPSLSEGLPVAVLEAWSHLLPVLMTRECNITVGFDRLAALEIKPSPIGISNGLAKLFSMSDRDRQLLGIHGRKLVEERFTWGKVADQMLNVYSWILGDGCKPASVL